MSESDKYKHIKVSSVRNDEVVIKAGSHHDEDSPKEPSLSNPEKEQKGDTSSSPHNDSEIREGTTTNAIAKDDSSHESDYAPTTLEDIKTTKMSKTQIAVIVIAILAIVAFVIWYVAFS